MTDEWSTPQCHGDQIDEATGGMGSLGSGQRRWTPAEKGAWGRKRQPKNREMRRVIRAIHAAREFVPGYGGDSPISTGDVRQLAHGVGLRIIRSTESMDSPAMLFPRWGGLYRLVVAPSLNALALRHVTLHEIGHVLTGDIEEPTILAFTGPLPEAEDVADLFSLVALLDPIECEQGPEFVESRIRELVPLDNYGWQTYRIPRLAGELIRLRSMMEE